MKSLSRVRLLATSWTAAYQAPLSMGFSRQEYWSGVPLPSPWIILLSLKSNVRWPYKTLTKGEEERPHEDRGRDQRQVMQPHTKEGPQAPGATRSGKSQGRILPHTSGGSSAQMTLGFQTSDSELWELWEKKFLLFRATRLVVICPGGPRTLTHPET